MSDDLNSIQQGFLDKWVVTEQRIFRLAAIWALLFAVYLWVTNPFGLLATVDWPPYLTAIGALPRLLPIICMLDVGILLFRGLRPDYIRHRMRRITRSQQRLRVSVFIVIAVGIVIWSSQIIGSTELIVTALLGIGTSWAMVAWSWWRLRQVATLSSLIDQP